MLWTLPPLVVVIGALLLRPGLPPGLPGAAGSVLRVLVGLSSTAAGVIPSHVDVSSPVALSAPVLIRAAPALLLLRRALPDPGGRPL